MRPINNVGRVHGWAAGEHLLGVDVGGRQSLRQGIGRAPADAFLYLAVGQSEYLLLGLQRILVGKIVRREQDGQRIVDEVQLLQAQHRLAFNVKVVTVGISDAVDRIAGLGNDLGVDEGPQLLSEKVRQVGDEVLRRIDLRDGDEDGRRVEGLVGDAGEIEGVDAIDHGCGRVVGAEELQAAAFVAGALRQIQVAAGRRDEGVDEQAGVDPGLADCSEWRGVGDDADQVDEIVVGDDLELLADRVELLVAIHERAGVADAFLKTGNRCLGGACLADHIDVGGKLQRLHGAGIESAVPAVASMEKLKNCG